MKIAILGAGGQLGKFVLSKMKSKWINVKGFEKSDLNITDIEPLTALNDFDVVINCAAYTNMKEQDNPNNYDVNFLGVKNIVDTIPPNVKMIHISSLSVFKPINELEKRFLENEIENKPNQKYGLYKNMADNYIVKNSRNFAIIRPSWLHSNGMTNFIYRMNNNKNKELSIVTDNLGQFTSGGMIVNAIEYILQNNFIGQMNVATREVISRYDLYKEYLNINKIDKKIRKVKMSDFNVDETELNYQLMNVDHYNSIDKRNLIEILNDWIKEEEWKQ